MWRNWGRMPAVVVAAVCDDSASFVVIVAASGWEIVGL